MELWVPITIAAAFLQNVRSALQKHLTGRLSTTGATFVRFGFGFPLAIAYVVFLHYGMGAPWPEPHVVFWAYTIGGGITQILATFLLVYLFTLRNFAVGTAYSRTEPLQAAVFGAVVLGDVTGAGAMIAIFIGVGGVVTISVAHAPRSIGGIAAALSGRSAMTGVASGAFFAMAAVFYRAASLSIAGEEGGTNQSGYLMQAGYTLVCVTVFQTFVMMIYMLLREPGQISAVVGQWRVASLVGLVGVLGSMGWFTAMTIQSVAYVKTLAQIELVFSLLSSWLIFKERITRAEIAGVILIVACIVILLMGRP